jgi:hypothetical protein
MIRKTFYIDRSQLVALRKLARLRGVSVSALGREAVAKIVRKYRKSPSRRTT